MKNNTNQLNGFTALFIAAICYSTFGFLFRQMAYSFQSFSQIAIRSFFALVYLILWFVVQKKKINLRVLHMPRFWIMVGTSVFSMVSLSYGITLIKASNAIFYIYAGLFISSLFYGKILFHESLNRLKIISLTIAFIGLGFLSWPITDSMFNIGVWLSFFAGVCDGLGVSMGKYLGDTDIDSKVFWQYLMIFIITTTCVFLFSEKIDVIQTRSVIAGIVFGIATIGMSSLYMYGFNRFDLQLGNIVASSELFFVIIINSILLHEYPTAFEFIGAICIFIAIAIINLALRNKANSSIM